MRLFKNAITHLRVKWHYIVGLLLIAIMLEMLYSVATISVSFHDNFIYQLILLGIKLFLESIVFCGIYRIAFENRKLFSALRFESNNLIVMDAFLIILILTNIVLRIYYQFGYIALILMIPVQCIVIFLPALALRGYRGLIGLKQAFEIIKSDYKQFVILFLVQAVSVVSMILIQILIIEFSLFTHVLFVMSFDIAVLLSFVGSVVVPLILLMMLQGVLKVLSAVMTIKYTQFL